tara:strand:+ start:1624 stop:2772 length:1149 start_codon:yes stop_codon:yes gene_type:complete
MSLIKLGQYFTKHISLKEKIHEFILNCPNTILEPSVGRGDLIDYLYNKIECRFDMYEIDNTIELMKNVPKNVIYIDFLKENITKKYDTIIGNPPYIKTSNGNLYINFVEKCYNLLNKNGELIFIVPSDFMKLTSSSKLLTNMMKSGTFTHIYHPNSEKLFENASIDVIVFRYCKNCELEKKVLYNNEIKFINCNNGIITFENNINNTDINRCLISEYFDVYVGIVSGKDSVFKNSIYGNIEVLNSKNKTDKFILLDSFPCDNNDLNTYLLNNKEELINRRIKKFNQKNWFEWGALRNIDKVKTNLNIPCIYVKNLTRDENIAFVGKVQYFGGSLLMMIPKKKIELEKVIGYLNNNNFKSNYMYSGRFKIGQKQLCNANISIV